MEYFLRRLKTQVAPYINSAMEGMVKQKINNLNLELKDKNLGQVLKTRGFSI
jgi:hypothetical protein